MSSISSTSNRKNICSNHTARDVAVLSVPTSKPHSMDAISKLVTEFRNQSKARHSKITMEAKNTAAASCVKYGTVPMPAD